MRRDRGSAVAGLSRARRRLMSRLVVLGTAVGVLATPLVAEAQPESRTYRVWTLVTVSQKEGAPYIKALEDGLLKLGWVEGRTLTFEHRYANLRPERFPDLAAELVRLKVDVIVAPSTAAIDAAHRATARLPIVMVQ